MRQEKTDEEPKNLGRRTVLDDYERTMIQHLKPSQL